MDRGLRYPSIKFTVPRYQGTVIERARLYEGLRGFAHRVTLIAAGPGYGKTTFVRGILDRGDRPVVWMTADERDNSQARFWGALVSALQRHDSRIGERVLKTLSAAGTGMDPEDGDMAALIQSLLTDLEQVEESFFLVIEDYHTILSEQIHGDLYRFIQSMPQSVHLILTTRSDPPFPVMKMKLSGQLVDIRQEQLRFSLDDTVRYFSDLPGLAEDPELLRQIHQRAEGWAAALQIYRISMERTDDPRRQAGRITGSNDFILDYLQEEVLNVLEPDVRRFLWTTALLGEFTEDLAREVSALADAGRILARLDGDHLFLETLSGNDRVIWYRYHQLFRELLTNVARREHPDEIADIHRKAAGWYAGGGLPLKAVESALKSGDSLFLTDTVDEQIEAIFAQGKLPEFLELTGRVSEELLSRSAKAGVFMAFGLFMEGKIRQAEQMMERLGAPDRQEDAGNIPEEDRGMVTGIAHTVRTAIALSGGHIRDALEHSEKALAHLPEDSMLALSLAHMNAGNAQKYCGHGQAAYDHFARGFAVSRHAGIPFITVSLGNKMISSLYQQGRLREAAHVADDVLEIIYDQGLEHSESRAWTDTLRLHILTEFAAYDQAQALARQLETMEERIRSVPTRGLLYLGLVRYYWAVGDMDMVNGVLERFQRLERNHQPHILVSGQIHPWRAKVRMQKGDLTRDALEELLDTVARARQAMGGYYDEDLLLTEAVLLARLRGPEAGIPLLENLAKRTGESGSALKETETLVTLAGLYMEDRQPGEAARVLERAERLARDHGYQRILQSIRERGEEDRPGQRPAAGLPEPLNDREIEILDCIGRGMTNRDISEQLYIAVSTVKWHTTNIYGKLGVANRTQAVNRARELHLIS